MRAYVLYKHPNIINRVYRIAIAADPGVTDTLTLCGYPSNGLLVPLYRVKSAADPFDRTKNIVAGTEKYFIRGEEMHIRSGGRWVLGHSLTGYARVLYLPHHVVAVTWASVADVFGDDGSTRTLDDVNPWSNTYAGATYYSTIAIGGTSRIVVSRSQSNVISIIDVSTGGIVREFTRTSTGDSSLFGAYGAFYVFSGLQGFPYPPVGRVFDADGNELQNYPELSYVYPRLMCDYLGSGVATRDGKIFFRNGDTWTEPIAGGFGGWFDRSRWFTGYGIIDPVNKTAIAQKFNYGGIFSLGGTAANPDPDAMIVWDDNICYANIVKLNDYTISQNPARAELLYFDNSRRADSWLHAQLG